MFSPAADHHQLLHYHCPPPPLPSPLMEHKISSKPTVEVAPNCPRCASSSTKFCYFNNYSLSQPRYFCKACRRYWTKGGSLRNVPVGGGCRKTRRGKSLRSDDRPASVSSSSQDSGDRSDTSNGDSADIDMAAVFAKFLNQNPGSGSESESQSCYDPNQPSVAVGGGGGVLPDPDRCPRPHEDERTEDHRVVLGNDDDFGLDSLLGDHHDRHRHEAVELQDVFWSDHETWQLQELEAFPTNLISDNWSPLDLYSGFEVFSRS